jgi:hypothetical protein
MSSRRAALVLTFAALSGGALGACGGNDELTDSVPKSTPDLTVPRDSAALAPAQTTTTTSTTGTVTTPTTTTSGGVTPAPTTTQAAPVQPTGGTPSGGTTTPSGGTGTTTPSNGGFSDFCQQNPGACGQ